MSDHGDYLFMHVRALCLLGESSTDVTAAATADGNSSRVLDNVEKVQNNCFLCSSNGREASECCVKLDGGSWANGHSGTNRGTAIACSWFDGRFPSDHPEREEKLKGAARARHTTLQTAKRRAKKASTTESGEYYPACPTMATICSCMCAHCAC